ncbi:hypothetical protein JCM33374_g6466 [Metschnikowia sp. JCM 33374]|nr:hypothetical protein JCM33374_g6466 [Metschnikowia sp. JCM 33374]
MHLSTLPITQQQKKATLSTTNNPQIPKFCQNEHSQQIVFASRSKTKSTTEAGSGLMASVPIVMWNGSRWCRHSGKASEAVQPQDLDDLIEEDAEDDFATMQFHISSPATQGSHPIVASADVRDISGDHKDKTATIEALPMSPTAVSIHPLQALFGHEGVYGHARAKETVSSGTSGGSNNVQLDDKYGWRLAGKWPK